MSGESLAEIWQAFYQTEHSHRIAEGLRGLEARGSGS